MTDDIQTLHDAITAINQRQDLSEEDQARVRAEVRRLDGQINDPPHSLRDRVAGLEATQTRMLHPQQAVNTPEQKPRVGIDLPTPEDLGRYGTALKKWGLRTLLILFGLIAAWKFATGDVVGSIERLWWVFNPPSEVEDLQDALDADSTGADVEVRVSP